MFVLIKTKERINKISYRSLIVHKHCLHLIFLPYTFLGQSDRGLNQLFIKVNIINTCIIIIMTIFIVIHILKQNQQYVFVSFHNIQCINHVKSGIGIIDSISLNQTLDCLRNTDLCSFYGDCREVGSHFENEGETRFSLFSNNHNIDDFCNNGKLSILT